ncbi:DUF488 domain-containing protein [Magnetovibrio sp. PR-2]|uniref:DUF488 domain-containing protein n=1 Tax=Magnetovibrio sp. PR-2 TaxID=3120356 RepID=UPI002FCE61C9
MTISVFTVGHSTHSIEKFIGMLDMHGITALADVRSSPYSQYNPQFNRESLKAALRCQGIQYVFLGEELGARSEDPKCYKDGKVQFDRLAQTELFREGLERVATGSEQYKISLMCAEKDPIECHRTILVSRSLKESGFSVIHILADGKTEAHEDLESRLIAMFKMNNHDLFLSADEILKKAYTKQGEAIAYTMKTEEEDADSRKRAQG